MGYTTIANVAGMFPTFARGTAQQKPADTLIQTYIDDVAAEINAVLVRRGFVATGLAAAGIQALLSPDAANICEMINRYGAAAQLGQTLATFGVLSAGTLAKTFADNYQRMKNDLDARDAQSRPLARREQPLDHSIELRARVTRVVAAGVVIFRDARLRAGQLLDASHAAAAELNG